MPVYRTNKKINTFVYSVNENGFSKRCLIQVVYHPETFLGILVPE